VKRGVVVGNAAVMPIALSAMQMRLRQEPFVTIQTSGSAFAARLKQRQQPQPVEGGVTR